MAKIKFGWKFEVSEDEQYLDVYLNDGLNCSINIFHVNFHLNLLNKLEEIMTFQFIHGTSTHVYGLDAIRVAKHIYNADFK